LLILWAQTLRNERANPRISAARPSAPALLREGPFTEKDRRCRKEYLRHLAIDKGETAWIMAHRPPRRPAANERRGEFGALDRSEHADMLGAVAKRPRTDQ
jgi:hypothetical protein